MPRNDVDIRVGSTYDPTGDQAAKTGLNKVKQSANSLGSAFQSVGKVATGMFAAFTAQRVIQGVITGFREAVQATTELDTAMVGLRDATGIAGAELDGFRQRFLELSPELLTSAEEMTQTAAAAALLENVPDEEIVSFTIAMQQAALAMPEFTGGAEEMVDVTGRLQGTYHLTNEESWNLLNAINEMANSTRGGAKAITDFMNRFQGAADTFGFTAQQSAALGSALTNMGIDGTRAARTLEMAIRTMDKQTEKAAETAGMLPDEFANLRNEDVLGAFMAVAKGLGGIDDISTRNILSAEIFGETSLKLVMPMVEGHGKIEAALQDVNEAYQDHSSIMTDVEAKQDSLEGQNIRLTESWKNMKIALTGVTTPLAVPFMEAMSDVLTATLQMADATKTVTERLNAMANVLIKTNIVAQIFGLADSTQDYADALIRLGQIFLKVNIVAHILGFADALDDMAEKMGTAKSSTHDMALNFEVDLSGMADKSDDFLGDMEDFATDFGDTMDDLPEYTEDSMSDTEDSFETHFEAIADNTDESMQDLADIIGGYGEEFAEGASDTMDDMENQFETDFDSMESFFEDWGRQHAQDYFSGWESEQGGHHFGGEHFGWSGYGYEERWNPDSGQWERSWFGQGSGGGQQYNTPPPTTTVQQSTNYNYQSSQQTNVNLMMGRGAFEAIVKESLFSAAMRGRL